MKMFNIILSRNNGALPIQSKYTCLELVFMLYSFGFNYYYYPIRLIENQMATWFVSRNLYLSNNRTKNTNTNLIILSELTEQGE